MFEAWKKMSEWFGKTYDASVNAPIYQPTSGSE
jgi:hypothetical protein